MSTRNDRFRDGGKGGDYEDEPKSRKKSRRGQPDSHGGSGNGAIRGASGFDIQRLPAHAVQRIPAFFLDADERVPRLIAGVPPLFEATMSYFGLDAILHPLKKPIMKIDLSAGAWNAEKSADGLVTSVTVRLAGGQLTAEQAAQGALIAFPGKVNSKPVTWRHPLALIVVKGGAFRVQARRSDPFLDRGVAFRLREEELAARWNAMTDGAQKAELDRQIRKWESLEVKSYARPTLATAASHLPTSWGSVVGPPVEYNRDPRTTGLAQVAPDFYATQRTQRLILLKTTGAPGLALQLMQSSVGEDPWTALLTSEEPEIREWVEKSGLAQARENRTLAGVETVSNTSLFVVFAPEAGEAGFEVLTWSEAVHGLPTRRAATSVMGTKVAGQDYLQKSDPIWTLPEGVLPRTLRLSVTDEGKVTLDSPDHRPGIEKALKAKAEAAAVEFEVEQARKKAVSTSIQTTAQKVTARTQGAVMTDATDLFE
jgi:hypothetical protein